MDLNVRVSYGGGGLEILPNLRGSKFQIFLEGGGGREWPQTSLVAMHAYACMSMLSHTTITLLLPCYHPVFQPQLKILYETLTPLMNQILIPQIMLQIDSFTET